MTSHDRPTCALFSAFQREENMSIEKEDRIKALATHLGIEADEAESIETFRYDDTLFGWGCAEYRVLTDEEADQAWDESLESYIDDCILPEVKDETLARYFDREAWKRDARPDGRGHCLSSYDGEEREVRLGDGTYLFIYRVN